MTEGTVFENMATVYVDDQLCHTSFLFVENVCVCGILDVKIAHGNVNSYSYCDFIETALLPHLMPFNGRNPHSVVIVNNCSIHHSPEALKMIQDLNVIVHFLPPYSPDYNPIEEAFSKVKAEMKSMEKETQLLDIGSVVLSAFTSITVTDCNQWIKDSSIYI